MSVRSARSTRIGINNETPYKLKLVNFIVRHGEWSYDVVPPFEIPSKSAGSFSSESAGFMTGTEGIVDYILDMPDPTIYYFHIYWDNPFVGKNRLECTINDNYENPYLIKEEIDYGIGEVKDEQFHEWKIHKEPSDLSGDNVIYTITLTQLI